MVHGCRETLSVIVVTQSSHVVVSPQAYSEGTVVVVHPPTRPASPAASQAGDRCPEVIVHVRMKVTVAVSEEQVVLLPQACRRHPHPSDALVHVEELPEAVPVR